jgi:hypothetical protein
MTVISEIGESLVTAIPVALAALPFVRPPRAIGEWVGYVLLTAAMSVASIGFLLMRLVAQCVSRIEPCPDGSVETVLLPGLLATYPNCVACLPQDLDTASHASLWLNGFQVQLATFAAGACTLASLTMLVKFARWAKRANQK